MPDITEGSKAPAFDMATADGGRVSLDALKGRKVVLYFYPKADTPGCTTESQDFSALVADFDQIGTTVLANQLLNDGNQVPGAEHDGDRPQAWGVVGGGNDDVDDGGQAGADCSAGGGRWRAQTCTSSAQSAGRPGC